MNKKIEVKFEQLSIADLYTLLEYSVENLPNNRKRYLIIHKYVHNELNKRMNFLTHQPMNATEKKYVEKLKELVGEVDYPEQSQDRQYIKKLKKEISALEQQISEEESYPREFVEWCIAHCDPHGGTEYWNEQDEVWVKATFEQIFEYWQSKVKNEKK